MKKAYTKPGIDTRTFAQFENVFTYCDREVGQSPCKDMSGSGNAGDKPAGTDPSLWTAHEVIATGS